MDVCMIHRNAPHFFEKHENDTDLHGFELNNATLKSVLIRVNLCLKILITLRVNLRANHL